MRPTWPCQPWIGLDWSECAAPLSGSSPRLEPGSREPAVAAQLVLALAPVALLHLEVEVLAVATRVVEERHCNGEAALDVLEQAALVRFTADLQVDGVDLRDPAFSMQRVSE
jgi:hypothetical protein